MRYKKLLEYIITGKPNENFNKTFVFLYEDKYAIMLNGDSEKDFAFGNGFRFNLTEQGKLNLYKLLSQNKFKDSFSQNEELRIENVLYRNKDYLIKNILPYFRIIERHQIDSEKVKEFFLKILANQSIQQPENFIKKLTTDIVYGKPNIKSSDNLKDVGKNEFLQKSIGVAIESPMHYLMVDHQKKTISRQELSLKYQTSMSNYGGRRMFVLPEFEFSIDRSDFIKLSKQLKNLFPSYKIVDFERSSKITSNINKVISNRKPVKAYHGTSNAIWKKIQRSNGLKPSLGKSYQDKILGHSEHLIYLSLDPDTARKYAIRAAGANDYVILEVYVEDINKIRFDEDSLIYAISKILKSERKTERLIKNLIFKLFPETTDHWAPESVIRNKFEDHIQGKLTSDQNKIFEYIKSYAVKTMKELSFGFKGIIPMKNISIYEEGKSVRTDMDPKTYPQEYEQAMQQMRKRDEI